MNARLFFLYSMYFLHENLISSFNDEKNLKLLQLPACEMQPSGEAEPDADLQGVCPLVVQVHLQI